MEPPPLLPTREEKRIQLQVLAPHRTGDRLKARLLPAAAGLDVLEDFVAANHACILHHQPASARFGPEHEGRVAVASPGDGDGSARRIVFDEAVLRQNPGGKGLRRLTAHDADDAIVGVHERRSGCGDELGIVNGDIRKTLCRLRGNRRSAEAQRGEHWKSNPSHHGYILCRGTASATAFGCADYTGGRNEGSAFVFQASLSADAIGIRAARSAGKAPPAMPIRTASTIPTASDVPLIRKANATSEKFAPPAAEVMPLAGRAIRQPSASPTMARKD